VRIDTSEKKQSTVVEKLSFIVADRTVAILCRFGSWGNSSGHLGGILFLLSLAFHFSVSRTG